MTDPDDLDVAADEVAWQFHPDRTAWAAVGVHSAADVARWAAFGITLGVLYEWRDACSGQGADPDNLMTLPAIGPWLAAGFTTFDAVWEWLNSGFEPRTAAAWSRAGFDSEWVIGLRTEVSIEDAVRGWEAAGFVEVADRAWWTMLMYDPQRARRWCDLISGVYDRARHPSQWEEAGLAAREWDLRGYAPEQAIGWIAVEIEIDFAADWIRYGFDDPVEVKALLAEGHTDPTRALAARLSR